MRPIEFQNLAERLIQSNDPAFLRTAVSRAYYAAHHTAKEIITSLGFRISSGSTAHAEVIRKLGNCGESSIVKIASKISTLQSYRLDADYRLMRPTNSVEDQKNVEFWVLSAREAIEGMEKCLCEPVRSRVVQGIREYESKI